MDKPQTKHKLFLNNKIRLSGLTQNGMVSNTTFGFFDKIKEVESIKMAAQAHDINYLIAGDDTEETGKMPDYPLINKQSGGKDGILLQLPPACNKLWEAYGALH
ncbi:MAG: hypothetical protein H0S84_12440 [Bacteroidales bacterium]|jgi:molybdate transport repressor ModE-like protein|nr:hypothetical protein [Bacteroidales bacterium]